jgi:Lon protease-like protein
VATPSLCVPLFPLPKGALLPGELLPLHIFEPRYRHMMQVVRQSSSKILAIAALLPGWEDDYEALPPVTPVVGLGQLVKDRLNPDGTSDIVLHGSCRGRITEEMPNTPFRKVRVQRQDPELSHPVAEFRLRRRLLTGLAAKLPEPIDYDVTATFDAGALADRIASALRLPPAHRVDVMQAFETRERIDTLLRLLEERRHRERLIELIPALGDYTLSLRHRKDTAR